MRLLMIYLFLLPLCFQHARAETTVPGSNCHSITPSQANLMEWREQGLKNSASTDYWINCPFERPAGRSEVELTVRAVNETEDALGLSCNFREFFGGKQQPGGKSVTADIAGEAYENLTVRLQPRQYDSVMNATCKLSKGIAVEATKVDVGNCSNESLFGHWTYTADFDYQGFELGIIRFDANGVFGEVFDSTGETVVAQGAFTVEEFCGAEIQITTKYAEVLAFGIIAEDRQTFQGIAVNDSGLSRSVILTRVDIDETIEAVLEPLATPR